MSEVRELQTRSLTFSSEFNMIRSDSEVKWKLESSNRYVKDEIYKFAKKLPDEQ